MKQSVQEQSTHLVSEGESVPSVTPAAHAHPAKTDREPDCWASIGVYGDRTCPDLVTQVHCRNCPVFSKAGLRLLSRPLPEGYLRQSTERYAKPARHHELSSSSAVPFRIASEWLALPTACFQEITERRPIHSLPHAHPMVLGLVNIRGELLICISLGHLLGLMNVPRRNIVRAKYERLLVLHWADRRFGVPVDEVQGPCRFYGEQVKPVPATLAKANSAYSESVLHWQQKTLVLIDPDLLISALNRNLT